jgi:hypothetical protein
MNIIEMVGDLDESSQAANDAAMDLAIKAFQKQRKAFNDLKGSHGLAEIIRWHRTEKRSCEDYFMSSDKVGRDQFYRGAYYVVGRFLSYMEGMLDEHELKAVDERIGGLDIFMNESAGS